MRRSPSGEVRLDRLELIRRDLNPAFHASLRLVGVNFVPAFRTGCRVPLGQAPHFVAEDDAGEVGREGIEPSTLGLKVRADRLRVAAGSRKSLQLLVIWAATNCR
jgi:hypothetical protein